MSVESRIKALEELTAGLRGGRFANADEFQNRPVSATAPLPHQWFNWNAKTKKWEPSSNSFHTLSHEVDNWEAGTTGTAGTTVTSRRLGVTTGTTANSLSRLRTDQDDAGWTAGSAQNVIDWTRRLILKIRFSVDSASTNSELRVLLGKTSGDSVADLGRRGIGFIINNLAFSGQVHDGSSLTTTASLQTLTVDQVYDLLIINQGNGTVEWIIDDVNVGSDTGGPAAASSADETRLWIEADNNADTTDVHLDVHQIAYLDIG